MKSLFDVNFPDNRSARAGESSGQAADEYGLAADSDRPRAAVHVRRSTLLRAKRLGELIGELSLHDMDIGDMSAFLGCSGSCVRNYVQELIDAWVICGPARPSSPEGDRSKKYRLTKDAEVVHRYLTDLSGCQPSRTFDASRIKATIKRSLAEPRYFHIIFRNCFTDEFRRPEVRRDPLVAALFGAAIRRGNSRR